MSTINISNQEDFTTFYNDLKSKSEQTQTIKHVTIADQVEIDAYTLAQLQTLLPNLESLEYRGNKLDEEEEEDEEKEEDEHGDCRCHRHDRHE